MTIFLLLFSLSPISSSLSNFPIVQTSYGAVRGYEYAAKNGFVGEIFKKIPYASPPTGSRRWKKPEPPAPWNYTHDGTFFGPACAQIPSMFKGSVAGISEDCLTLNIYTSKQCRESNASCPVIFYVHGGMGYFGGVAFPDDTLVTNYPTQGVVLVTITYRLGPFGTLALGDENAVPANLGLHDVVESLRFVRKEIHKFGGDKDRISVMGHSSGANIILTLVFSPAINKPRETPLFTRAIIMSGSAIYESEVKQVNVSQGMAARVGCVGSARQVMDCLLPLEKDKIIRAATKQGGFDPFSIRHLGGVTLAGELMPIRNTKELRDDQKARMSQLAGFPPTKLMIGTLLDEFGTSLGNPKDQRVTACGVLGVQNEEECIQRYWRNVASGKFRPGYEPLSQSIFLSTALFAQAQARAGGEVYVYQLDYPKHASHADDLYYTMGTQVHSKDINEEWISHVYPIYFTNFAKGQPLAPNWVPFDAEQRNYYSINKSFTDGVAPMMKLNYSKEIYNYYEGMMEFDENLTKMKGKVLTSIEARSGSLFSTEPNLRDFLFYVTITFLILFIFFNLYHSLRDRTSSEEETTRLVS